jgi:hypothetical protein
MNSNSDDSKYFSKYLMKYCVDPSDTKYLKSIDNIQLNEILPFLVRLWKKSQENCFEIKNTKYKQEIFKKIIKCENTNNICFYLDADFSQIYDDIIRTLSLRFFFNLL